MENAPVIVERLINAPVSRVWKALTDKAQMKEWYFDVSDFQPVVGFEFSFSGGKDDKRFLHLCRVTEAIPERKIAYTWRYDGYTGDSLVTIELFEQDGKTRVHLTHTGLETFPQETGDFAKGNFVVGWTQIIGTSLPKFVEYS
ncbi:SRPBCC family protein [Dinghuibacter silviterrae]|uniref:Uncharacterized protein YndB with AHSA1/START domain n=1 Tax=Dinghuibacter silviterrae TaxID=1539049 RepID=A0A4V3GLU6_9BACT|nr:SRPBCC domain-containing protein [Dinghuibacter silviterrae]TDX00863.1 uncharacterized protein YndB with AHSA1/START domain [Dinghuibacter silviterrae]